MSKHHQSSSDCDHFGSDTETVRRAAALEIEFCDHGHVRLIFKDDEDRPFADFGLDPEGVRNLTAYFATQTARQARANGYRAMGESDG